MERPEAIKWLKRIAVQDEESGRPECVEAEKLGIVALIYVDRLCACSLTHRQAFTKRLASIEDRGLSDDRIQRLRESPLAEKRG